MDLKRFLKNKFDHFIYWANHRNHHRYRNWNSFFMNLLWAVIFSFVIAIIYSNIPKLNEIKLWFIPLGSVLLLISFIFWIKYVWRFLKKIKYWYRGERNWVKYLVIIIILLFLWQAYQQRETAFDPAIQWYTGLNFTEIFPLSVNWSTSGDSSSSDSGKGLFGDISDTVSETVRGEDRDIGEIELEILVLVNEERQRNGARTLSSKSNLNSFARGWSDKMISQDFFEHSDMNFAFPSTAAENIGETPIHYNVVGCGSTYSNSNIAECFVSGWITSPGHHTNMIGKSFSMTGIGVACDSSKCRATQVFAG